MYKDEKQKKIKSVRKILTPDFYETLKRNMKVLIAIERAKQMAKEEA